VVWVLPGRIGRDRRPSMRIRYGIKTNMLYENTLKRLNYYGFTRADREGSAPVNAAPASARGEVMHRVSVDSAKSRGRPGWVCMFVGDVGLYV
jgi:hypothetical protein